MEHLQPSENRSVRESSERLRYAHPAYLQQKKDVQQNETATRFADDVAMTLFAAAPTSGVRATEEVTARVALDEPKPRGFDGRYVICARLAVDPGRYQLRIGVCRAASSRAGSVYLEVDVPDFAGQTVSISDVALGQTVARVSVPAARRQTIEGLVSFVPTFARDFNTTDKAWAFVRIYQWSRAPGGPIVVRATVSGHESGAIAWSSGEPTVVDFGARNESEYRLDVPLSTLAPGAYRLRIESGPQSGNGRTASRELDFRVTAQ